MADGLSMRPAGADDGEALCALFDAVFPDNPKASPDVLRWQYWDNPFGEAVSWVAERSGRLVGHFAVLPYPATIDGTPGRLTLTVDAATLPEAQGRGVMGRLARAVFDDCARRGVPITMCLPNYKARGALKKIGMVDVSRLRVHVRPFDDAWLAGRFHVPRAVAAGSRRIVFGRVPAAAGSRVETVPDGLDDLVARTRGSARTGVVHDAAWWRWRYVDAPFPYRFHELREGGRLVAAAVTRVRPGYGARFMFLLDLVAEDRAAAASVVSAASAERDGAVGIATLAVPGTRMARFARACGMRRLPRSLEPQPAVLGVVRNDPSARAPAPRSWDVSWCDLDHV